MDMKKKSTSMIQFPMIDIRSTIALGQAMASRRSRRSFNRNEPVPLSSLGFLLWAAGGVTDPEGLRSVPSAGATYPLEIFAAIGNVTDVPSGLYHYDPEQNGIALLSAGDLRPQLARAAMGQSMIADAALTIILAANHQGTAARYGDRSARYIHNEVGHSGQNIYLAAESLGLGTCAVGAFHDSEVKKILGGSEEPLYLLPVGYPK